MRTSRLVKGVVCWLLTHSHNCTPTYLFEFMDHVPGELPSIAGLGLFSHLQQLLTPTPMPKYHDRLSLTEAARDALDDFRWLAASVQTSTRWCELVRSS